LRDYKHPPLKRTQTKKPKKKRDTNAYIVHPLIRAYFYESLSTDEKKSANMLLRKYIHTMQVPKLPKDVSQMRPLFDELYYLCEAGDYEEAYEFYRVKIAKEDEIGEDDPGYLITVLLAYQTDAELLAMFFEDRDWSKELRISAPEARADVLILAGVALEYLGDLANAVLLNERSALTGIEAEKWEFATWAYQNIADIYISTGRLNEALGAANLALEYAQRIKARSRESLATYMISAWIRFLLGDIPAAFEMIRQADRIFEEDKQEFQSSLFGIEETWRSAIQAKIGRYQEAMATAKTNLRNLKKHGWIDDMGQRRILASVYLAQTRHTSALRLLDEAIQTMKNVSGKEELALSLLWRGKCLLDMQHYSQARQDLEAALDITQKYHYMWELDVRNSLIQLELLTSNSKPVLAKLRRQLLGIQSTAILSGYKWAEGDTLFLLGELERSDDNLKKAKQFYRQCWEVRKIISDPQVSQIKQEYLVEY
jgi:tetratricopeptide (TPR) repeat protein